jgi:acyl-CoA hydrolase
MRIADANNGGNVHGGVIMYLCDEVAGMTFLHPVYVGHLVTVKATVNAAWNSSMEVGVRVEAENIRSRELTHTSTAYLTMVALDEEGRPVAVPPITPETRDEERRAREAQLRRDNRLAERERIEAERTD